MAHSPSIVWFRQDLRVSDNPALHAAVARGAPVLCLYVRDRTTPNIRPLGGAHEWWLHHALVALDRALRDRGASLLIRSGPASDVVADTAAEIGAAELHMNERYDPEARALDDAIAARLNESGCAATQHRAHLMHDPSRLRTKAGGFYKVYTPFWRAFIAGDAPREPLPAPSEIVPAGGNLASEGVADLALLPSAPDWSTGFSEWHPGEDGARERLDTFLDHHLDGYVTGREAPGRDVTSKLSPHLKFGDISPFQVWHATDRKEGTVPAEDFETFRKELVWREFNHHLLYNIGALESRNVHRKYDALPWRDVEGEAKGDLRAWQRGRTGYPIVDAGMRQLWQSGWQHNRVRMICASFLVKHLLIDWREGERWYWDCLVDGDPASNPGNWQWVAGTGADASPFFRIFNPITQGPKFDGDGDYVRRWVPELAELPTRHIHAPWEAPASALAKAGLRLGRDYPEPIVEHRFARARALDALQSIKNAAA